MIAHIVFFEPKPDISPAQRQTFLDALREAITGIAEIQAAKIGRPLSFGVIPENNTGQTTYSFAAVLEFKDRAALQVYLQHTKHDSLRRIFWESCQSTMIADVELTDIESFIA